MAEAAQRRLHNNGLARRFYGEGLSSKAPTDEEGE